MEGTRADGRRGTGEGCGRTGGGQGGVKRRYRSSLRSQRMLREAFVSLLPEKDVERITVTDVTRRADLNRGTFYSHYANMEALLRDVLGVLADQLYEVVDRSLADDFLENPEPVLELVGLYLSQDRALYEAILRSGNANAFVSGIHRAILARVRASMGLGQGTPEGQDTAPLVQAEFMAGGLVSIYRAWVTGKYGDIPVEQVNRLAADCVRIREPNQR